MGRKWLVANCFGLFLLFRVFCGRPIRICFCSYLWNACMVESHSDKKSCGVRLNKEPISGDICFHKLCPINKKNGITLGPNGKKVARCNLFQPFRALGRHPQWFPFTNAPAGTLPQNLRKISAKFPQNSAKFRKISAKFGFGPDRKISPPLKDNH